MWQHIHNCQRHANAQSADGHRHPPPTATAVPTVDPVVAAQCFGLGANTRPATQVGDLVFAPVMLGFIPYPSVLLPDGTPLNQPYKMTHNSYVDFPCSPLTNPNLTQFGAGFRLDVSNVSANARHSLQGISVRIDSFTAYGGQLNQWNECSGTIDSHHNPTPQGCGGAVAGCVCFRASFSAGAAAGASVTAGQTDGSLHAPGDGLANFPYVLGPGMSITLIVSTVAPTAPGRYVFNLGLTYDGGSSPVYAGTPAPEVLLAPVAHTWDGRTCMNTPALLAQITPTAPETYYICSQ